MYIYMYVYIYMYMYIYIYIYVYTGWCRISTVNSSKWWALMTQKRALGAQGPCQASLGKGGTRAARYDALLGVGPEVHGIHKYIYLYIYIDKYVYEYMYIHMYMSIFTYIYIYRYMYMYMYVYIWLPTSSSGPALLALLTHLLQPATSSDFFTRQDSFGSFNRSPFCHAAQIAESPYIVFDSCCRSMLIAI